MTVQPATLFLVRSTSRGGGCVTVGKTPPRCVCARIFARQAQRGGGDAKNLNRVTKYGVAFLHWRFGQL